MKLFLLIVTVFLSTQVKAENLRVSFVIPDEYKSSHFWELVSDVTKSMAEDLKVELEFHHSSAYRFSLKTTLEQIIKRDKKPNYIVFRAFQGNAVEVFDLLERSDIPFVTLEQNFNADEAKLIGMPRQKYKKWLGMINYDNLAGGRMLAEALFLEHQVRNLSKKMPVTGIGGDFELLSQTREAGLILSSNHVNGISVNQIFPLNWSSELVKQRFNSIFMRYPNTTAFWCASDFMALEVINQLDKLGWPEDKNILVGGFDWMPEALEKIHQGKMTVSVGGHFLMGSKAILNLVEYHHGHDIFKKSNTRYQYELIDSNNINTYLPFMQKAPWRNIDFSQFSHTKANKAPKKLSVANVLEAYQLAQQPQAK